MKSHEKYLRRLDEMEREHTEMKAASYAARRKALGHTQASLAEVLGLARGTIARRETGALRITPEAALALLACPKTKRAPGK